MAIVRNARMRSLAIGVGLLLGAAPGATQERTTSLVMSGEPPSLFLLYTGDVIGYIEPCG
ncbi:MAG TPA: hypothetical protein VD788_08935 [Candidatus Polarisedimenticolaceae bacterium]|nr:hypothetical protein [Candidatus Polarisedimenticolaceae bacterium]